MNTYKLILTFLLSILTNNLSLADIWIVNNQPGFNANFSSIQDANDTANSGDTLYVIGSPINYGAVTISKTLSIIGPGYFLSENPNTQENKHPANVFELTILQGADSTKLVGMSVETINIYSNNAIIKRNHCSNIFIAPTSENSLLQQN